MKPRLTFTILSFVLLLFFLAIESKSRDPYKVLGVDKTASQREIQKAFHKLSLQYHPDKNKNKGAQEKFAEINNAYDLLSDEEKRKNYDLYGDEKGSPGFGPGSTGQTYYSSGGPGHGGGFNFRPDGWQNMGGGGGGGGGGSKTFSFSFGGPSSSQNSFGGFGFDDMFSNFFGGGGMGGGSQFGGFGNSGKTQSRTKTSPKNILSVNSDFYKKEIEDKGVTWLLLSYTSTLQGKQHFESILDTVGTSLQGALKVGSINCEASTSLCKELGIYPRKVPRVFLYSYKSSETGSLVEYNDDLEVKNLKNFCQENLPKFSKRVNLAQFDSSSSSMSVGSLPRVMLLSIKKDTPVIWRALSGLFRKRVIFYDTQVNDVSDTKVEKLGVDALPAIVGWLSNGEKHVIKTGISVKDLKSAIQDISVLLNNFEKMNKKVVSSGQSKESESKSIPILTQSNFNDICGDETPVCLLGVYRSTKAKENLEKVLLAVSQKSLSRRQNMASGGKDLISYGLVDGNKQKSFLSAFDKSGFKSYDVFLVAYKPRKGKFASFVGEIEIEELEKFVSEVLNGDVQFVKVRQKAVLK